MAIANSITPFPSDIDRIEFGHWLSGFTDGEGCFLLYLAKNRNRGMRCRARFKIGLRRDDSPVLRTVQSYWGTGSVTNFRKGTMPNAKPAVAYAVTSIHDLQNIVIPHFERFPLRAKKRRDFLVWRTGVDLIARIGRRTPISNGRGRCARWLPEERDAFIALCAQLKMVRKYDFHETPISTTPIPRRPNLVLFD